MPSASSSPPVVANGLISGLNTPQIIQAMLAPYQQPETDLQNQQATINSNVGDYQQINADLLSLQNAATTLATSSGWGARTATSSDTTVATATADAGTPLGAVQFIVKNLAAADSLVSSGTVASPANVVDSAPGFLLSQGGAQLGLATLAGSGALTLGAHTVTVTQASQAASTTGTVSLGSQSSGIAVASGADTLSVAVDGTTYNLAIADAPGGGYSGSGLLTAVQNAITAAGAGGVLSAGYDSSGNLILSTSAQGSTQSLQVTGGTALGVLGLSAMGSAATGVDGIVNVDGTTTTLSTITAGGALTLNAPAGSVAATVVGASTQAQVNSSLLSTGSLTATNVSTGSGSLNDLVANVNAAGTGVTAAAVQTGPNQYVLQLSSTTTGSAADLSVDTNAFAGSSLGSMRVASAGTDAQIQVGGSGGYLLSSATDTFNGLLPGLSVTVAQTTSSPVTVSVGSDAASVAGSVKSLVDAANTVLSDIQSYAGYNAQTKQGGPLMGSGPLGSLQQAVLSIFGSNQGTSNLGNAKNVGISLDSGKLTFDQSAFESAFAAHPTQVAALFSQGGAFAPGPAGTAGEVSLSYASNATKAGTYDVTVTHSATQASSLGASLGGGTVGAAETLTIAMGGQSVAYTTTAGQSLSSIAAGLNQAFATGGVGVSAEVTAGGTQLELVSDAYGSAQQFTVTTSNTAAGTTGLAGPGAVTGTPTSFSGSDVAGTINGVAATGSGQYLSAPLSDPTLAGLSLRVTAAGITSSTDLGSFTYTPGVAQAVASLASAMADPVTGEITQTIKGMQTQSTGLNSQISFYAQIVAQQQKLYMAEFATLESQLGALKNQSSELAAQLSKLS
ncbi:MAG TPA: flagellar filament capping protein FliD [Acidimicrobiales bacterium]|nr:flagellar filament capping protein FliD [Acidimicrobiales bacterium]